MNRDRLELTKAALTGLASAPYYDRADPQAIARAAVALADATLTALRRGAPASDPSPVLVSEDTNGL
jgi:hypothetical protein